jgi:hypothetical protein
LAKRNFDAAEIVPQPRSGMRHVIVMFAIGLSLQEVGERTMAKRHVDSVSENPVHFFSKELSGETPPAFSTLQTLYGLAAKLYALRPWDFLDESELFLVQDPLTGQTCYCSVMGALGEVFAMHAYVGAESFRLFHRIAAGEQVEAGEFFWSQHSVYVDFVSKGELAGQDRKLLAALGHQSDRGKTFPIFRAIRPGYHPWFVTEEEAQTLAECLRAVVAACSVIFTQEEVNYWDRDHSYPMVSRVDGATGEPRYRVELVEVVPPLEAPLSPAELNQEQLRQLRGHDRQMQGVMELDYLRSSVPIGKKNERKACTTVALAVDAHSGFIFASELAGPGFPIGDVLATAFMKAIGTTRMLPQEVRVRSRRIKACLAPISEACGVPIKDIASLPALDEAREHLLNLLGGTSSVLE